MSEIIRKIAYPVVAGSLASVMVSGCSSSGSEASPQPKQSCDTPGPLTKVNDIGPNKQDTENAVNKGECGAIYEPTSLKTIGKLATNEAFDIICIDSKPNAFRVLAGNNIHGDVNLSNDLYGQIVDGAFSEVPMCQ